MLVAIGVAFVFIVIVVTLLLVVIAMISNQVNATIILFLFGCVTLLNNLVYDRWL